MNLDLPAQASEGLLQQALGQYRLPRGTVPRLASISENEVYHLTAPNGLQWALRLQRPGYQSLQSLASEIAWLLALRADGVAATPVPCAGVGGDWVQCVRDPASGETRNLVLFAWEEGTEPTIEMDLQTTFRRLGAIIARMHTHSRTWQRPPGFTRFSWDVEAALGEEARWGNWRLGPGMTPARVDLFSQAATLVRRRLSAFGTGPGRFGLAHCDMRLANLLLHEGAVKVIDFDDCGFTWYMADVANVLSFYEHLPQTAGLIRNLLEGYRTIAGLSQEEEDEIPTFLLLRRLSLLAWIGSHAETQTAISMGPAFTEQTVPLCVACLKQLDR